MTLNYSYLIVCLACTAGCFSQVYNASSSENIISDHNVVEFAETVKSEKNVNDLITQTVYGFLDFTTTIGNTKMIFSPLSAPPPGIEKKQDQPTATTSTESAIETKPTVPKKSAEIQPSKPHKLDFQDEMKYKGKNVKIVVNSIVHESQHKKPGTEIPKIEAEPNQSLALSSIVELLTSVEQPVKNNIAEPEYDYLSKQPTEVIDETYKVINLKPSSKIALKQRQSAKKERENQTEIVTRMGGTIVKDGLTTVHETSVISTYINGKYTQVLQSASKILKPGTLVLTEGKIRASNSQKILKTIGPQHGKLKPQLEPTPAVQQQGESSLPLEGIFHSAIGQSNTKASIKSFGNNSARPQSKNKMLEDGENFESSQQSKNSNKNRPATTKPSYKNRPPLTLTTTTTTEVAPTTRRRSGFRPSTNHQLNLPSKAFRQKTESNTPLNPIPKMKLPRTQGRWSYKTTPKPRIAIRKQSDDEEKVVLATNMSTPPTNEVVSSFANDEKLLSSPPAQNKIQESLTSNEELDSSETEEVSRTSVQNDEQADLILPVDTINVQISTPADFNDVYFEIATIKSPYAFQVGTSKNTRYITLTSTIKKSFATAEVSSITTSTEPLTENILANTGAAYESSLPLDSSVATLPAITLESGQATPPLKTSTETFTTTQTLLKTHLLPVVSSGNTTTLTLVQTYNIARMVTATKTLPPSELYHFIPLKTLNEFNSKLDEAGSELHLELDFGEDRDDDDDIPKRVVVPNNDDLDSSVFKNLQTQKSASKSSTQDPPLISEHAQQIALLKFLSQQPQQQILTTSRPVIVLETLFESHVIPLVSNGNTIFSTLSRPISTVSRTNYEYGTSTLTPIIPPHIPQLQQMPQVPLFPPQPQFTVTTAPIVTQTLTTISDSRVLKLTFGAKTAYTTLFSTRVVPTDLTTYVTSTIAVQPTVPAFAGYFPPPVGYPGYPYVG